MISTFWVIWGNECCRLIKPLILRVQTNIITRFFNLHFSKKFSVSFVVSLTTNRDITFHKRATVYIWFIKPWRINGISFSIWKSSLTLCIFCVKIYINCGGNCLALLSFLVLLIVSNFPKRLVYTVLHKYLQVNWC